MKLDLLLKEIPDLIVRENFFRSKRELEAQQILSGFWHFFEVEFQHSGPLQPIKHNLSFIPQDIIILSVEGNHNLFFNHENFDSTNVYITVEGPCRVRFFAGKYSDKSYGGDKKDLPFVAVLGSGGSSSSIAKKAGTIPGGSFTGTPKKYTINFATPYPDATYAIAISGQASRSYTYESKTASGFTINSNANAVIVGEVSYITTAAGET